MWYDAYAALCALLGAALDLETVEELKNGDSGELDVDGLKVEEIEARMKEPRKVLLEVAKAMKDARYY